RSDGSLPGDEVHAAVLFAHACHQPLLAILPAKPGEDEDRLRGSSLNRTLLRKATERTAVIVRAAQTNPMPPLLIRSLLLALLFAPAQAQPQAWAWDDGTVPYVQTPAEIVERMMRMAEVRTGDFVIDLGSGDGRIVIE